MVEHVSGRLVKKSCKNAPLRRRAHRESKKRTVMDARRSMHVREAIGKPPLRTLRLGGEICADYSGIIVGFAAKTHR